MSQMSLEDPGSAFLASGDPARFLEDNLPAAEPKETEDEDHVSVAVGIAGAFLAWRLLVRHRLRQIPAPTEPEHEVPSFLWKLTPFWVRIAGPSVLDAYKRFAPALTQEEREAIASDYVARLGQYVHQTSADALVEGYRTQLTRGVNPTLAWMRAVEAFGLESKKMRSWLAGQGVDLTGWTGIVPPAAKRSLDKALFMRADLLGQTEAWQLRMVARNMVWMAALRDGTLPAGARKRWVTADDEMVCPICRPLHLNEVLVDEQFRLPDGRNVWAPGVHPNCRCELELVYPEIFVEKAAPGDPYDRDRRGRFSRQESRQRQRPVAEAPVTEREVLPEVAALFEAMREMPAEPEEKVLPSALGGLPSVAQRGLPSTSGTLPAPMIMPSALPALPDVAPMLPSAMPLLPSVTPAQRQLIIMAERGKPGAGEHVGGRKLWIAADYFWPAMFHGYPQVYLGEDSSSGPTNTYPRVDQSWIENESYIDFDEWALRRQRRDDLPEPRYFTNVHVTDGFELPRQLFTSLAANYDDASRVTQFEKDFSEEYYKVRDRFEAKMLRNVDVEAPRLSNTDLRNIFRSAAQYRTIDFLGSDTTAMRHQLIASVQNYGTADNTEADSAVAHAYVSYMADHHTEMAQATAWETEDEAGDLRENFLRVPQIFTFQDNRWAGIDHIEGQPGTTGIRGRYKVVAIKKHSMLQDFNDPRNIPRSEDFDEALSGSARFPAWEEVVLELIPD